MILISYTPQLSLPGDSLLYSWSGRVLTATLIRDGREISEQFDFSVLQPEETVEAIEPDVLPITPIIAARCLEDGTLDIQLLLWYYEEEEPKLKDEVLDG